MTYSYKYERPALTVDGVIFGVAPGDLKVLLIQRQQDPFKDCWALPGGFFDMEDNSAEDGAAREIFEETGIRDLHLEQFFTFSSKGRDPRERVVSIAHYAVAPQGSLHPIAGDDARAVAWHDINSLPALAFDHRSVIGRALDRLRTVGSLLHKLNAEEFERVRATRFACED